MKNLLLAALAGGLVMTQGLAGQTTRTSIQGVWQAVEVTLTGPAARTVVIPPPRPNLTIFTARHYSQMHVDDVIARPVIAEVAKATADELRAAWGPFAGDAGTYEVTAALITTRPIVAKNPATMAPGAFITYSYKLNGDTLWVTFQKNQNGPIVNPATIKAVRVE